MLRLLLPVTDALGLELIGTVEAFICFVCRSSIEFMQGFRDQFSYDIIFLLLYSVWNSSSASFLYLEARCASCRLVAAGSGRMLPSIFCAGLR